MATEEDILDARRAMLVSQRNGAHLQSQRVEHSPRQELAAVAQSFLFQAVVILVVFLNAKALAHDVSWSALAAFVLATIVLEVWRGTGARTRRRIKPWKWSSWQTPRSGPNI